MMDNPQFWGWLFQGEARAEFDALPKDKQEQVVRATLRLMKGHTVLQIVLDCARELREQQPLFVDCDANWMDVQYRAPTHINSRCIIMPMSPSAFTTGA